MSRFLILFIFFSGVCFGQTNITTISDTTKTSNWSIIPNVQILMGNNTGGFYNSGYYTEKQKKIYSKPMFAYSIGIKYRNLFQTLSFSNAKINLDPNAGNFEAFQNQTYYNYQIGYVFLSNKWNTINPVASLSLASLNKNSEFNSIDSGPGTSIYKYSDKSKLLLVQLPVGIHINNKKFFLEATYFIPIYSTISGSFGYYYLRRPSGPFSTPTIDNGEYSGSLFEKEYKSNMFGVFGVRVGVNLFGGKNNSTTKQLKEKPNKQHNEKTDTLKNIISIGNNINIVSTLNFGFNPLLIGNLSYIRKIGENNNFGLGSTVLAVIQDQLLVIILADFEYNFNRKFAVNYSPGVLVSGTKQQNNGVYSKLQYSYNFAHRLGIKSHFHLNRFQISPSINAYHFKNTQQIMSDPFLMLGIEVGYKF